MDFDSILIWILAVPFAGAVLILLFPRENKEVIRRVGILTAAITLILTAIVWWSVAPRGGEMQFVVNQPWIGGEGPVPTENFSVCFHLGVDGLSAPMLFLTALLTTLSLFYSARTIEERVGDPTRMPALLVRSHGPFTWGLDVDDAVDNAIALEEVAVMALATLALAPDVSPVGEALLRRHFDRKHGPGAYYGQVGPDPLRRGLEKG